MRAVVECGRVRGRIYSGYLLDFVSKRRKERSAAVATHIAGIKPYFSQNK